MENGGEFADGAIIKSDGEIGQFAGLFTSGFLPAVQVPVDNKRRAVNRVAGEWRQIIITMRFSFLRLDADRREEVNQVDAVDLLEGEMFHTSQFLFHTVKIERGKVISYS